MCTSKYLIKLNRCYSRSFLKLILFIKFLNYISITLIIILNEIWIFEEFHACGFLHLNLNDYEINFSTRNTANLSIWNWFRTDKERKSHLLKFYLLLNSFNSCLIFNILFRMIKKIFSYYYNYLKLIFKIFLEKVGFTIEK